MLRSLLDSFDGDVALSLTAYNAGPGNVKQAIPNIPETRAYVLKVLDNYQSYRLKQVNIRSLVSSNPKRLLKY